MEGRGKKRKKEQAKSFLSLCTIWIVPGIKSGTFCRAEKKITPRWMQNASCILSVFLKPWRRYPRACGVEALMLWWLVFVHLPWGSKMRAWELRANLGHNEFLGQWGSVWGQAASSKQSGWVSGLGVSRQSQGQENGPSAINMDICPSPWGGSPSSATSQVHNQMLKPAT